MTWLKEHTPLHKPVIIVITAYADQKFKDVDPELVAGILRKPFDVTEVGTLVRACIQGFQSALQSGAFASEETVRTLSATAMAQLRSLRAERGNGHSQN